MARGKTSVQLIEMAEEGVIGWETLARDLVAWVSELGIERFADVNGYIEFEEENGDV